MADTSTSLGRVLLIVAGTSFWPLVLGGIFAHNNALIGVALGLFFVTMLIAIIVSLRASAAKKADTLRIWTQGTRGQARIIAIGTKGKKTNGNPAIDFELEVSLPVQAPYHAKLTALVSQLAIPRIQPGCQIEVRVDPQDKTRLVIDAALTPYGYE